MDLITLGCLGILDGRVTLEPHSIVMKLRGGVESLQLSYRESPNFICKDPVATFKGIANGLTTPCIVPGREENTVSLVAS